jgi:hypothetical protein
VKKKPPTPERSSKASVISDSELARFLKRLAGMFQDSLTGNPELARALSHLGDRLRRNELPPRIPRRPPSSHTELTPRADLKTLDATEVEEFLRDDRNTKADLIALAHARFSIPRSTLMRLSSFEVREKIRSALAHETSLDILSREAGRSGASRSS